MNKVNAIFSLFATTTATDVNQGESNLNMLRNLNFQNEDPKIQKVALSMIDLSTRFNEVFKHRIKDFQTKISNAPHVKNDASNIKITATKALEILEDELKLLTPEEIKKVHMFLREMVELLKSVGLYPADMIKLLDMKHDKCSGDKRKLILDLVDDKSADVVNDFKDVIECVIAQIKLISQKYLESVFQHIKLMESQLFKTSQNPDDSIIP